jgi:hypothetical protein
MAVEDMEDQLEEAVTRREGDTTAHREADMEGLIEAE